MNSLPTPDEDDPLEELTSRAADEFMEQLDRGENPNIDAFVAGHPQIADVLRRLLPALEAMRDSSARPAPPLTAPPVVPEVDRPGRLGDFEIIREIGRGGMGVVYEAVQLSLGRRVALKVLPFAAMLDPHRLQRFQNEARAAACLHHGNIVPIFAVGSDRGVHFYAMQYIEGRNLAALIRDTRRQLGVPGSSDEEEGEKGRKGERENRSPSRSPSPFLPVTPSSPPSSDVPTKVDAALSTQHSSMPDAGFHTAARLALQAAEALHHAHQQGVVHRDVKPANVIVDATGRLWVTDFGLAQVQSDPRLTTTGNILGTLRYMSPEQASGDQVVDHRTDVFSLGATLYELLALEPAFGGRDRATVLRRVVQEDPKPLHRINPSIPADLETIVGKAMAKSPADRYSTAQALADDLRRFLEDKPILARRPSLLEKVAKWSRRRRHLVAAVMAVLFLAVCGLTASTVLISCQKAETQKALDLVKQEEKDKEDALNRLKAEQLQKDDALNRLKAEQLQKDAALDAAGRERQRAEEAAWKARVVLARFTQLSEDEIPDTPELRPVRQDLLAAALEYYKDFIEQEGDNPKVKDEMVASKLQVAGILQRMGEKDQSLAVLEQLRQDLHASTPGLTGLKALMGDPGLSVSNLLTQGDVQQDLKLSKDQINQITALIGKRREPSLLPHSARDEVEKACFEVLKPDQAKRLQQIVWQQRGAYVFADDEVAKELELSPTQRERIRRFIQPEDPLHELFHRGKHSDERMSASDRMRGVLAVLTDDQKATWNGIIGEPFKGEFRFMSAPHY